MLQELALAAAAWSAAALDNAWFALEMNSFLAEHIVERRPAIVDEPISVDELVPGQRVSVRVADANGLLQFVDGCVEEVVEERIVLSRSIAQEVEVKFFPSAWVAAIPYVCEHWGHYGVYHTMEYRGVSVIPFAEARSIEPANWPDWIVEGSLPYKICVGGEPNFWYLDP